jgi:Methyltransferase domain
VSAPSTTFAQTFDDVADVQGWMTEAQAQRLWDRARELTPPARVVEIGSYQGRSAIVFGRAVTPGVEVVAIDPHAGNDRGPQQIHGAPDEGQADHEVFLTNLAAAGVSDAVRHVRLPSQDAHPAVDGEIDVLYIDGAHRFVPARDDIRDWGARVREGGTMLIHDSFSSIGVTLALFSQLFFGGRYRYVGRSGSMTEYRRQRLGLGDRLANAGRQAAQLPWFARNVVIKVLIVAKLGRLTRYLGHREPTWPF